MRYSKCCVPGCSNTRQDVLLHKFPTRVERQIKWLDFVNSASLRILSEEELSKRCVCHIHFETRFLTYKSRLSIQAYPTLFTEQEISSGKPTNSDSESINVKCEHNYSRREHNDHNYCALKPAELAPSCLDKTDSNILALQNVPSTSQKDTGITQSTSSALITESCDQSTIINERLQTPKKKRIVPNIKKLTPTCKKLYKEYRKSRKLLSFTRRAKKALHFCKEQSFDQLTTLMNPAAKSILWMQVKQCTKSKKGRRFSDEEKLIYLAIQKQSPKGYKFLQKIFILPSATTLKKMVAKLKIGCGINTQLFSAIKQEVTTWKEEKKFCSVVFDEMALDPAVHYSNKDFISGFVDLTQRTNDFADHVLCFMVKGTIYKWQQQ